MYTIYKSQPREIVHENTHASEIMYILNFRVEIWKKAELSFKS